MKCSIVRSGQFFKVLHPQIGIAGDEQLTMLLDKLVIVKSQQFINKKPEASKVMEYDTSEHGYVGYY
jgi:hypothetical protein